MIYVSPVKNGFISPVCLFPRNSFITKNLSGTVSRVHVLVIPYTTENSILSVVFVSGLQ